MENEDLFISFNRIFTKFHGQKNVVRIHKRTTGSPLTPPTWSVSHLLYFLSSQAGVSRERPCPVPGTNTVGFRGTLAPCGCCLEAVCSRESQHVENPLCRRGGLTSTGVSPSLLPGNSNEREMAKQLIFWYLNGWPLPGYPSLL